MVDGRVSEYVCACLCVCDTCWWQTLERDDGEHALEKLKVILFRLLVVVLHTSGGRLRF